MDANQAAAAGLLSVLAFFFLMLLFMSSVFATKILSDDFESGTTAKWYECDPGTNHITTQQVHSGTYALKFDGGYGPCVQFLSKESDRIYMSFWQFYPANFDDANAPGRHGWRLTYAAGDQYQVYQIDTGPWDNFMTDFFWGGDVHYSDLVPNGFPKGQWFHFEYLVQLNTPGQSNGEFTIWINGAQTHKTAGALWRTTGVSNKINMLELNTNYDNCLNNCFWYLDDVEVWDNVPNGTNIPPNFNFSLTNSGSKTITQGQSTANTISTTLSSGTTQSVSFSASGLPTGATASFSPTPCNPTCTTTLTIKTINSTPSGNYTINVNGNGGGLIRTTNFRLTVNTIITNSCSWDFFPRDIPDGKVTLADILVIVSDFGKTSTSPGFNLKMDFNNNNQIDLFDVLSVVAHFGGC